jgi:hypothetical protein
MPNELGKFPRDGSELEFAGTVGQVQIRERQIQRRVRYLAKKMKNPLLVLATLNVP